MDPKGWHFGWRQRKLDFELARREKGNGWWGERPPETHGAAFGRIRVVPSILPAAATVCHGDHAGHYETSLMMYLRPHAVDLTQLETKSFWYTDAPDNLARLATAEDGERFFIAMVEAWVAECNMSGDCLRRQSTPPINKCG